MQKNKNWNKLGQEITAVQRDFLLAVKKIEQKRDLKLIKLIKEYDSAKTRSLSAILKKSR